MSEYWQEIDVPSIYGEKLYGLWDPETKEIWYRYEPTQEWMLFYGYALNIQDAADLLYYDFLGGVYINQLGIKLSFKHLTIKSFGGKRYQMRNVIIDLLGRTIECRWSAPLKRLWVKRTNSDIWDLFAGLAIDLPDALTLYVHVLLGMMFEKNMKKTIAQKSFGTKHEITD